MNVALLRHWRRTLSQTLLTPRCLVCKAHGADGLDLCTDCLAALPWNHTACPRCALPVPHANLCGNCLRKPPPMTTTRAALIYRFPIDRLAPRLKFHQDLAAGRLLADLMLRSSVNTEPPEILIPIPLHHARLRQRGYDQALELARPLGQMLRIPVQPNALIRQRLTQPQSELQAKDRTRNLRGAFAVNTKIALPTHVALIDDVMTTGATLEAAAHALLKAGIKRVDAWVCARVP